MVKLIDLVEDLYRKTKCAIKINGKTTVFFKYSKGVRQGCPLSPLLFNIFVNDVFDHVNEVSQNDPVQLGDNCPVNILMYADDLVILEKSESELQLKLDTLGAFFNNRGLEIHVKKTK